MPQLMELENTKAPEGGQKAAAGENPFGLSGLIALVFITSFCTLFLELLYPKIFYFVKVMPGFEMVLVAVNMLGMAVGGLFSFLVRGSVRSLAWSVFLFAPAVALSFAACIFLSNDFLIISLLTVPFFFAAVIVSQSFILARPSWIYAASLFGAGLGVVSIFFLIAPLGGEGCMILACAAAAASGVILFRSGRGRALPALSCVLAAGFIFLLGFQLETDRLNLIRIFPRSMKYPGRTAQVGSDAIRLLHAKLLATRWSLITRIDVIQVEHSQMLLCFPEGIEHLAPSPLRDDLRDTYWTNVNLYYNNEAFTAMAKSPEMKSPLPYALLDRPSVLVIGTGGGMDLAKAFGADAREVTGVEINPGTVDLMENQFAGMNGGVYRRSRIFTMDGRTFVHRSAEKYDLINLMFAELYIAFPGSQVFIENYLYTEEAFDDYVAHLSDGGLLYVTKPLVQSDTRLMDQMLRIFTTAYESLERAGVSEPWRHIWFLGMRCDVAPFSGGHLLVKKTPFTGEDNEKIRGLVAEPFYVVFDPGQGLDQADNPVISYIRAKNKDEFYDAYPDDVRPCPDDKPFFYVFDKTLASHKFFFKKFLAAIGLLNFLPIAVVLLAAGRLKHRGYPLALTVFAGLGAAYMLTQAVWIQKLNVFLGSPSYSLAVVIGSFLVFGAVGSMIAGRLSTRSFLAVVLLIPCALAIEYFLFSTVTTLAFGRSLGVRILAAIALVSPFAILLGTPFPRALEKAKQAFGERDAGLFYAVDSAFAVLAVVSSIMLSIMIGFNRVFVIAIVLYVLIAALFMVWELTVKE